VMASDFITNLYWNLWKMVGFPWLKYMLRIIWVFFNNCYCIPVYVCYMILFIPVYFLNPRMYFGIEETFFSWLLAMVGSWSYTAGYEIAESGDNLDILKKEHLLLMPNHQSTADVPLCMTIFNTRIGFSNKVMWIMDKIFKYSNFGIISWIHDDFFILAGKNNREASCIKLREHLYKVFIPKERQYLVLFPEGGFLKKRKSISHSFAKKNDLPLLEHVTLPRIGALDIILDVLCGPLSSNNITKVVDVTVAYPDQSDPLDLPSIITGWKEPCTTHVHYRAFDVDQLPTTTKELSSWMVSLYQDKEAMLAKYYETGKFPHDMFDKNAQAPTLIEHSGWRYLGLHLFFVASSYLMWISFCFVRAKIF